MICSFYHKQHILYFMSMRLLDSLQHSFEHHSELTIYSCQSTFVRCLQMNHNSHNDLFYIYGIRNQNHAFQEFTFLCSYYHTMRMGYCIYGNNFQRCILRNALCIQTMFASPLFRFCVNANFHFAIFKREDVILYIGSVDRHA